MVISILHSQCCCHGKLQHEQKYFLIHRNGTGACDQTDFQCSGDIIFKTTPVPKLLCIADSMRGTLYMGPIWFIFGLPLYNIHHNNFIPCRKE